MSVLVLNADFQPLNVTTFRRGFNLVYKGKAEIVEHDASVDPIRSKEGRSYKRPLVIRLIRFIYVPFKKVPLSRYNIYRRDGHKCGYCGSDKVLTLDHVIPKSRPGGVNSWENLVTCCKKCNSKKDNKTPAEAGMTLRVKLYRPTYQQFIRGMKFNKDKAWSNYV